MTIFCPGCRIIAEPGTYPLQMAWAEDSTDEIKWWCSSCLKLNLAMEHAGDCRCAGCAR